jgi:L-ascorbate metabolism protein UlaG (beta-lactamase superfamily)
MLTHQALIQDIDTCQVGDAELVIWWLGQHSFVVKTGSTILYIDPFLSEMAGRQVAPLLSPAQIHHADIICGTHDHDDHIDRGSWPALAAASPKACFVVPDMVRQSVAQEQGIAEARLIGLDDARAVEIDGVRITGIAAAHEFLDQDPLTGRYPNLGYVIEANGFALYHSGDCCIYEGLQTKLRAWHFDVIFLPINGRDAVRLAAGCIGNMTYQEAADLAGALQPELTIPSHYEMFAMNSQDPRPFVDYMHVKYPRLRTTLLEHGVAYRYQRP